MNPYCKRIVVVVAAALLLPSAWVFPARAQRAQFDAIVFDFNAAEGVSEKWMGRALTDYTIKLLNGNGARRAMPREEMRRLTMRLMPENGGMESYDSLERIRQYAGAAAVVEGTLQPRRGSLDFVGTFIDEDKGVLEDLSFSADVADFAQLAKLLRGKLAEAGLLKNAGDFGKVAGTSNMKAFEANWRGVYLYENGDSARAMPLLEEAVKQDQKYVEPYLTLGKILLEKADLNLAAEKFSKAVTLAPDDPRGHFLLGLAYTLLRKTDSAEKEIRKALELYPDNPEYIYQLGVMYKSAFKIVESRDAFRKAVELDPSISDAWYELAALFSNQRKESETLEYLRKAVEWGGRKVVARLKNDTDFDWLRDNPKFLVILNTVK